MKAASLGYRYTQSQQNEQEIFGFLNFTSLLVKKNPQICAFQFLEQNIVLLFRCTKAMPLEETK